MAPRLCVSHSPVRELLCTARVAPPHRQVVQLCVGRFDVGGRP